MEPKPGFAITKTSCLLVVRFCWLVASKHMWLSH